MQLNEYQKNAARTIDQELDGFLGLIHAAMGAAGEAGEMVNEVKKSVFHGHPNREKIIEELGDTLWYIAEAATRLGVALEYIARQNIEKIAARYPDGFSKERSQNREGGTDE